MIINILPPPRNTAGSLGFTKNYALNHGLNQPVCCSIRFHERDIDRPP
jgi:hypothetical protein